MGGPEAAVPVVPRRDVPRVVRQHLLEAPPRRLGPPRGELGEPGGERRQGAEAAIGLRGLFGARGNHDVEGVDTYNACYGGTAALFNTVAWMESRAWDGRYGLVVCVDIAELGDEKAFLDGAAAVAMLVGPDAALVLEPERTSHMMHTWDFYKPVGWVDPFPLMRDGKHSIDVYTACLDGCQKALGERLVELVPLAQADVTPGRSRACPRSRRTPARAWSAAPPCAPRSSSRSPTSTPGPTVASTSRPRCARAARRTPST